jgi:hypothetical protein
VLESSVIYCALHLLRAFIFYLCLGTAFAVRVFCSCMVRIKFIAWQRSPIVSPKFCLMASDEALKVSVKQWETSTEQLEESLGCQQMVASAEASS